MIMALIYRNVPRKKTNELLLLGEQISAEEAERPASSTASCRPTSSTPRWPTGRKLARKSPVLMRLGKDAMFRQQDMAFTDALEYLHAQLTIALSTEDISRASRRSSRSASPVWKGR